jgi:hypothetical protein
VSCYSEDWLEEDWLEKTKLEEAIAVPAANAPEIMCERKTHAS